MKSLHERAWDYYVEHHGDSVAAVNAWEELGPRSQTAMIQAVWDEEETKKCQKTVALLRFGQEVEKEVWMYLTDLNNQNLTAYQRVLNAVKASARDAKAWRDHCRKLQKDAVAATKAAGVKRGTKVRLVKISSSLLKEIPRRDVAELRSMIGQVFTVKGVDKFGHPEISSGLHTLWLDPDEYEKA